MLKVLNSKAHFKNWKEKKIFSENILGKKKYTLRLFQHYLCFKYEVRINSYMLLPPYISHSTYLLKSSEILTDWNGNGIEIAGVKSDGIRNGHGTDRAGQKLWDRNIMDRVNKADSCTLWKHRQPPGQGKSREGPVRSSSSQISYSYISCKIY